MIFNKTRSFPRIARVIAAALVLAGASCSGDSRPVTRTVLPSTGTIKKYISTTGTVEPRNRLKIIPAIAGRVEKVLVTEGQEVRRGQLLAWLSSTERAALIDAARMQGDKEMRYWESVYKATPVVAPIAGTVIVRAVEPGQTVTTATEMLVLADRLVVKANVDETDIGNVRKGMAAEISLDSYPDIQVRGRVAHIAYESTTTNNVTMYNVDIVPDTIPSVFRSGMSATINIIELEKKDALTVPLEAVTMEGRTNFVLVAGAKERKPERRQVTLGITDGPSVEILAGLKPDERIVIVERTAEKKAQAKTNPFMPQRPGSRKR